VACVAVFVLLVTSETAQKLLCVPPLIWLGDVSFGMYVLHDTVGNSLTAWSCIWMVQGGLSFDAGAILGLLLVQMPVLCVISHVFTRFWDEWLAQRMVRAVTKHTFQTTHSCWPLSLSAVQAWVAVNRANTVFLVVCIVWLGFGDLAVHNTLPSGECVQKVLTVYDTTQRMYIHTLMNGTVWNLAVANPSRYLTAGAAPAMNSFVRNPVGALGVELWICLGAVDTAGTGWDGARYQVGDVRPADCDTVESLGFMWKDEWRGTTRRSVYDVYDADGTLGIWETYHHVSGAITPRYFGDAILSFSIPATRNYC